MKGAVKFINKFEETATSIAAENGYKYVMCGHIHHPEIKEYETEHGKVTYLNSGDWIENLSALEYQNGAWSIYKYSDEEFADSESQANEIHETDYHSDYTPKELYGRMLQEMLIVAPKN